MGNRLLAIALGVFSVAVLAACDDPSAGNQAAQSSPVAKQSAQDPAIKEAVNASTTFDVGHTVHITASGIKPETLVSGCCDPIVFKNETGSPATIIFNVGKKGSGAIAPGSSWNWTPPNPESILYHLSTGEQGMIQVESPNW